MMGSGLLAIILKLFFLFSLNIQRATSDDGEPSSCSVCRDGSSIPFNFANVSIVIPGLEFVRNCGMLENLLSTLDSTNPTCTSIQPFEREIAASCGCNGTEDLSTATFPSNTTPNASELCTLCRDGGELTYPEKNVTPFLVRNAELFSESFPFFPDPNSLGTLSCQNLAEFLDSIFTLSKETVECNQLQITLGGICGCQRADRYCTFCPNDEYIPQADKIIQFTPQAFRVDGVRVPVLTCSELRETLTQFDDFDTDLCLQVNEEQYTCGCNGGERYYMGADSDVKKAFLAWVPRITGVLSLLGSMWIIIDVLRSNENRKMFSQIMFGISVFDCLSSVAWICSSAPSPEYADGEPTGVYGAIGNNSTCKTQAFFVELGLIGSISFNAVLSIYYVLVIVKHYREFQFQHLRRWFLVMPIIVACTYAFTGLPHYDYVIISCHVAPYPVHPTHTLTLGFVLLPLGVAWCVCSFNVGWIYWSVRKQSIAARKWRFPTTERNGITTGCTSHSSHSQQASNTPTNSNLCFSCLCRPLRFMLNDANDNSANAREEENGRVPNGANTGTQRNRRVSMGRAVAWQAAFYLCSFLLTWPFYFISFLDMTIQSYGFWVLVVTFTPLQGFFNWIVYMRPRWGLRVYKRKQRRQLKHTGNGFNKRPVPPISHNKSSAPSSLSVPAKDEKVDMTCCDNIDSVEPTSHDNGGDSDYGDDEEIANHIATGIESIDQQVILEQSGDSSSDCSRENESAQY